MSGKTPVAIRRSTARTVSTVTPFRLMIAIERSPSACVCESSGERFNVQLTNSARRSEKSQREAAQRCSSNSVRSAMAAPRRSLGPAGKHAQRQPRTRA
jgi:hypothetical protein